MERSSKVNNNINLGSRFYKDEEYIKKSVDQRIKYIRKQIADLKGKDCRLERFKFETDFEHLWSKNRTNYIDTLYGWTIGWLLGTKTYRQHINTIHDDLIVNKEGSIQILTGDEEVDIETSLSLDELCNKKMLGKRLFEIWMRYGGETIPTMFKKDKKNNLELGRFKKKAVEHIGESDVKEAVFRKLLKCTLEKKFQLKNRPVVFEEMLVDIMVELSGDKNEEKVKGDLRKIFYFILETDKLTKLDKEQSKYVADVLLISAVESKKTGASVVNKAIQAIKSYLLNNVTWKVPQVEEGAAFTSVIRWLKSIKSFSGA